MLAVASSIAVCGREMKALDTFAKTNSWGFSSHEKDACSIGKGGICVVVGVSLWLRARVLNFRDDISLDRTPVSCWEVVYVLNLGGPCDFCSFGT